MSAFYNEIDPYCAQWLRNLIAAGLIPDGVVDERSIEDIAPDELAGFTQCHFFAGIAGWPLALRQAGILDDYPLWTGSCPCQPFSLAGKGGGFADERHLWPTFDWLIGQCRPDLVLGEQVEGPAGRKWLDLVATDLEGHGYAFGTAVFPAAGVGAPQIRHRTYWMARPERAGLAIRERIGRVQPGTLGTYERQAAVRGGDIGRLADADGRDASTEGLQRGGQHGQRAQDGSAVRGGYCWAWAGPSADMDRAGPVNGFWRASDWLYCRDGKWRPTQSEIFPLATGIPSRVGKLRAAGNALCVPQAVAFIKAAMSMPLFAEVEGDA